MYNLISQNCLSGNIYTNCLKEQFGNPFIWSVIDFNSMLYLIQNWFEINFKNYELVKDEYWNFSIIIDNNVKVQYVHYKFNPKHKIPTMDSSLDNIGNIYYYKIWEYIIQKYEERLSRMLDAKKDPIFCICNFNTIFPDAIYNKKQLEILAKYKNVRILYGCEHKEPSESAYIFYETYLK